MKKFLMIASAAAMAVTMPAIAKPGNGNGGGNGGGQAAQGGGKHARGGGGGNGAAHASKPAKANGNAAKASNGGMRQAQRVEGRAFKGVERSARAQNKATERRFKAETRQAQRVERQRFDDDRFDTRRFEDRTFRTQTAFAGNRPDCPPGLAAKNNGCLPPGQAMKLGVGQRFQQDWFRNSALPYDYRNLLADNDRYYYRYDDNGYIYRVDRESDLVAGLIPLLGGGFQVGQVLPMGYDAYNVPLQYRSTYFDTDDLYYRFGDNAIYQVDPQTRMVENVVALLTGQNFNVGQQMPMGYDMYNVPYQYRDTYYDTAQYNYRYADGYIYQVDPTTQIIQSVIQALI